MLTGPLTMADGPERGSERSVCAAELLRRTALGNGAALESSYRLFAARVFGLSKRVARDRNRAMEVTEDVLLETWRRAGRFDAAKGSAAVCGEPGHEPETTATTKEVIFG